MILKHSGFKVYITDYQLQKNTYIAADVVWRKWW
jgi:hypothetical protein